MPWIYRVGASGALALLLGIAIGTLSVTADAAEKPKKKRNYVVGEYAGKRLEAAHELLSEGKYVEAREKLDGLSMKRLNPYELAVTWQGYGYVESGQERYAKAVEAFENALKEDALPEAAQLNAQYVVAQLHMGLEQPGKAIPLLEDWLSRSEKPAAYAYYLLATAYVQKGDYAKALSPAKTAVESSDQPKEPWLQLLLAIRYEKLQYREMAAVLGELVRRFPKKSYFLQLSAVYSELGENETSLVIQQLAYQQGYLEEDRELRTLAQLYLFHQIPYRAADVLETGLEANLIEPDEEAWRLLANSWVAAREYKKAVEPLEKAAELSDKGDLYVRLGQVFLEEEEWQKARQAFSRGLAKGDLSDPGNAQLMLGISHYNTKDLKSARRSFQQAANKGKSRKQAAQWLEHLEREGPQSAN